MRHLVACPECKRQYDATGMSPGSVLRCTCGAKVTVPPVRSHDASVVRCSWCGAPRTGDRERCPYCGAEFTLREKDLHTICPSCMTRVSDKARFCHHCGTAIVPQEQPGAVTQHGCPVCGPEKKLRSRRLPGTGMPVMECPGCGGLWIGTGAFQAVLERARQSALPPATEGGIAAPEKDRSKKSAPSQQGPFYRNCIVCGKLMNRTNYGRISGVIIDICSEHGVWFDPEELERLVGWIRQGGLALSAERTKLEEKSSRIHAASLAPSAAPGSRGGGRGGSGIFDAVADIITDLFIR